MAEDWAHSLLRILESFTQNLCNHTGGERPTSQHVCTLHTTPLESSSKTFFFLCMHNGRNPGVFYIATGSLVMGA